MPKWDKYFRLAVRGRENLLLYTEITKIQKKFYEKPLGASATPTATTMPGTVTATPQPGASATPTATTMPPTVTPISTVTATIDPDTGGTVTSDDGNVMLEFLGGAVQSITTIIYSEQGEPSETSEGFQFAGTSFTLEAFDENNDQIKTFKKNFTLTVKYENEDLMNAGIKSEDDLSLFYWNGSQWVDLMGCDGCIHDPETNNFTIMLDHFTEFALLGKNNMSNQLYLPLISR